MSDDEKQEIKESCDVSDEHIAYCELMRNFGCEEYQ